MRPYISHFAKHAFCKRCLKSNIILALIVGTILALINHFDAIFIGPFTKINLIQILITYLVPFFVASMGAGIHAMDHEIRDLKRKRK